MEGTRTHLKINEIRCPYCRNKSKGVLPYYEELGLPKINGVNNISNSHTSYVKVCNYEGKNPNYDANLSINMYNSQMMKCYYMGTPINFFDGQLCGENYGDENCYCWKHKKQIIKKYKKELSDKMKEDIKQSKLQAKEKMKQEKMSIKMKMKTNINTNTCEENTVLVNVSTIPNGCIALIKTGKNKGNACNCNVFCENKCKRHFNIQNKKINIVETI